MIFGVLSYQCTLSFQENSSAGIINRRTDPDKCICALRRPGYSSIPAFAIDCSAENHLAPAIEDAEVFDTADADSYWRQFIIQPISVGCKSRWNKNIRISFKNLHQYSC